MSDRPASGAWLVSEPDDLRQSLEDAEERFRIFRELTSDFVYVVDVRADGSFDNHWLSESFEAIFGDDAGTFASIHWRDLVHPDDHHLARRRVKDLVRGRTFHGQIRMFDSQGVLHWIEDRAKPVVDKETGRVTKIYGVAKDVTARQRADSLLRRDEETYRRLVVTSPIPIVVHAGEKLVFANEAAAVVLAAPSSETLIGLPIWDFVHVDEVGQTRRRLVEVYGGGRDSRTRSGRLRRLDGEWIDVELVSNRTEYRGRPAAEVLFQDVTERNRMLREREALAVRAVRAQKLESLGALAAGIAHDFNNILVGVLGHTDLAIEHLPPDTSVRCHLDEISHGAQHAADLVQQLLDFAGEKRLHVRRLDLSDLVGEMTELLAASIKHQARVDYELAAGLPVIEADPTQIKQVLMNLVVNAAEAVGAAGRVDAGVEAGVRVRTTTESGPCLDDECFLADPGCRRVVLEVADRGVGMDDWTRRHLFEPFYTTKPSGRGLGMATVLGIIRGHHGALRLDSAPGVGTTIRVAFPARS